MDEIREILARIPVFDGQNPKAYGIIRLGGLTNRVFRIDGAGGRFVLRVPGPGTEAYIDRGVEAHNAAIAADAGVGAPLVWADPKSGLMVTEYISGLTMDAERFRDLGAVGRAGRAFRRLHDCGEIFQARFELFHKIDEYLAVLAAAKATIPEGYDEVRGQADAVRRALVAYPAPLAPCHCDPLAENFLDEGDVMFVVDWEYSGMNDPMWDLGDLSVEADFGPEQEAALLEAYFEGPPPAGARARMVVYKAMCDLLWTLWGVLQQVNGNPAEDFGAYAARRLGRCRRLMASPGFAGEVALIAEGR